MYIGIDVGGMSIKAGLVTEEGKLVAKHSVPTPLDTNESFCNAMYEAVKGAMEKGGVSEGIKAVGIGAPGVVDRENVCLLYSNNIPYKNAPVGEFLKKRLGVPVFVENDANCAALGEYYMAENAKNFVFITLGTGVGGGIVINGKLFIGTNGAGAELGHVVTHAGGRKCTCGRYGCWEAYASTSGLMKLTEENRDKLGLDRNEKITGKTAFDLMRKGNEEANRVCDEWIEEVALGITNVVNIFQPDEVVVGGAIAKEGDTILKPVISYVAKNDFTASQKDLKKSKIIAPRAGDDAGIIGAALLWKNKNEQEG